MCTSFTLTRTHTEMMSILKRALGNPNLVFYWLHEYWSWETEIVWTGFTASTVVYVIPNYSGDQELDYWRINNTIFVYHLIFISKLLQTYFQTIQPFLFAFHQLLSVFFPSTYYCPCIFGSSYICWLFTGSKIATVLLYTTYYLPIGFIPLSYSSTVAPPVNMITQQLIAEQTKIISWLRQCK